MENIIYDPKTHLHYKLVGDYYIPLVKAPEPPNIGIWGHRRLDYIKKHRRGIYSAMWFADTLNTHLEETDRQATALYDRLIKQFATAEGITEELKAANQMEWVAQMNNIHSRVTEIVNAEYIFV